MPNHPGFFKVTELTWCCRRCGCIVHARLLEKHTVEDQAITRLKLRIIDLENKQ